MTRSRENQKGNQLTQTATGLVSSKYSEPLAPTITLILGGMTTHV